MPNETEMRGYEPHRIGYTDSCRNGRTVHQIFAARAVATPDALAVVFGDEALTYGRLNARANRLARRLRDLGVGPGTIVGLFAERSVELVIGVIGILKAGGAYLPIDLAYPRQRQAFMLADAAVPVLVTQRPLASRLPETAAQVVFLDEPADWPADDTDPPAAATPDDLAYVIYTSGSTGTPKGVLVTHQNVVRLFDATDDWFHFGPADVWTLFHSIAFDFSVWELWGALLYGGRLVVIPYLTSRSPEDFYRLLHDCRVTVLNQTPSAFRQLVRAEEAFGEAAGGLALRYVIFGGEALDPPSLKPWFDRHGDRSPQLVNMYGITETTVHVTYRPLTAADVAARGSPIGRPIPDLRVHVLDDQQRPVPPGVRGEMYVGGAGVARGYLNRPELSAERFVPDPFGGSGDRLYKSGDLAVVRADGELEFLGRADGQVKLRGFRIELGEVGAALARHPQVRESVAIVREDVPDDKRLVAYVAARPGASLDPGGLRDWLRQSLPEYMVPSAVVVLPALPLTTNGKIDRDALPLPPRMAASTAAPATQWERAIVDVCERILHCGVGAEDNFFDLGATSLHLAEIHAELTKDHAHNLSVTDLFRHPTARTLGRRLAGLDDGAAAIDDAQTRARRQREALGHRRPVPGRGT